MSRFALVLSLLGAVALSQADNSADLPGAEADLAADSSGNKTYLAADIPANSTDLPVNRTYLIADLPDNSTDLPVNRTYLIADLRDNSTDLPVNRTYLIADLPETFTDLPDTSFDLSDTSLDLPVVKEQLPVTVLEQDLTLPEQETSDSMVPQEEEFSFAGAKNAEENSENEEEGVIVQLENVNGVLSPTLQKKSTRPNDFPLVESVEVSSSPVNSEFEDTLINEPDVSPMQNSSDPTSVVSGSFNQKMNEGVLISTVEEEPFRMFLDGEDSSLLPVEEVQVDPNLIDISYILEEADLSDNLLFAAEPPSMDDSDLFWGNEKPIKDNSEQLTNGDEKVASEDFQEQIPSTDLEASVQEEPSEDLIIFSVNPLDENPFENSFDVDENLTPAEYDGPEVFIEENQTAPMDFDESIPLEPMAGSPSFENGEAGMMPDFSTLDLGSPPIGSDYFYYEDPMINATPENPNNQDYDYIMNPEEEMAVEVENKEEVFQPADNENQDGSPSFEEIPQLPDRVDDESPSIFIIKINVIRPNTPYRRADIHNPVPSPLFNYVKRMLRRISDYKSSIRASPDYSLDYSPSEAVFHSHQHHGFSHPQEFRGDAHNQGLQEGAYDAEVRGDVSAPNLQGSAHGPNLLTGAYVSDLQGSAYGSGLQGDAYGPVLHPIVTQEGTHGQGFHGSAYGPHPQGNVHTQGLHPFVRQIRQNAEVARTRAMDYVRGFQNRPGYGPGYPLYPYGYDGHY